MGPLQPGPRPLPGPPGMIPYRPPGPPGPIPVGGPPQGYFSPLSTPHGPPLGHPFMPPGPPPGPGLVSPYGQLQR